MKTNYPLLTKVVANTMRLTAESSKTAIDSTPFQFIWCEYF